METTETETIDRGLLLSKTAMALYVVKSSPFEKLKYLLDLWKKYFKKIKNVNAHC